MIEIGEDLVGAYLSRIENCSIVQFNVRTGVAQAEIDVVGLALEGTRVARVWLCEVSTHTGGLGGYGGDAAGKIRKKVASVRRYADATFPDVPRIIELWSPKVSPAMSKNERGRSGWIGRGAGAHAPALAYRECRIGYTRSSLLQCFDQHRLQPRSEVAMAELNRPRLTVEQIVERVATEGVFVLSCESVPMGERELWRAGLRRAARAISVRLVIREVGGFFLISGGSGDERIAQLGHALDEVGGVDIVGDDSDDHQTEGLPANYPSRGPHLRLVRDPGTE